MTDATTPTDPPLALPREVANALRVAARDLEVLRDSIAKVRREALDWSRAPEGMSVEARYVGSYLLTLLPPEADR